MMHELNHGAHQMNGQADMSSIGHGWTTQEEKTTILDGDPSEADYLKERNYPYHRISEYSLRIGPEAKVFSRVGVFGESSHRGIQRLFFGVGRSCPAIRCRETRGGHCGLRGGTSWSDNDTFAAWFFSQGLHSPCR